MSINWSWDQVEAAVDDLAKRFVDVKTTTEKIAICGIPVGGIIPAVMLRKKLKNCNLAIININNREDFLNFLGFDRVIFVDDINDSGETLEGIKEKMEDIFQGLPKPLFVFATLIKRRKSKTISYSSIDIEDDTWFSFPWEYNEEEMRNRDE